jgi:hypothetical protein
MSLLKSLWTRTRMTQQMQCTTVTPFCASRTRQTAGRTACVCHAMLNACERKCRFQQRPYDLLGETTGFLRRRSFLQPREEEVVSAWPQQPAQLRCIGIQLIAALAM